MVKTCHIQWLGQREYSAAWRLQKELAAKRAADEIPNTLLLLEHPHTFTIGIDGHREHLLINKEELTRLDIAYHEVDRGGWVTYHGPGQLVAYPILNLAEYNYSYHRYISMLEKVIIHTLATFRVRAFRERGQPGVWTFANTPPVATHGWVQSHTGTAKIADIGVKVDQHQITSHGFSINVNPNLEYFNLIIPSGLQGCNITSLRHALNRSIEIGSVLEPVIQSFCEDFELEPFQKNESVMVA